MPVQDIYLPLTSQAQPSAEAIAACVAITHALEARLTAVAIDAAADPAARSFEAFSRFGQPVSASSNPRGALDAVVAEAVRRGVACHRVVLAGTVESEPALLAEAARLHDLALLPLRSHDSAIEKTLLALVFTSGRPLLIFPQERAAKLPIAFDRVAIAWNRSAQAARAVADALPFLRAAASVQIFTVSDKPSDVEAASGGALIRHLAAHGIDATFEAVPLAGSSVGKVFENYVKANAIDLLVMGGYGRSWLKEFTWGGATNTILESPPCWVLMSH
nr:MULTISPECIES: universal stress protein [unclassified Bradyrhizobium]